MQLIGISTVLATLSLGALGAALPEAAGLEARANGGVYICTDINFSGQCIHLSNPFGNCGMFLFSQLAGDCYSLHPIQFLF